MTQADRDRLVTLKKVKKKLITQREAAEELDVTVRQVKRLLRALKQRGDKAVIHGLRGRPSIRRIPDAVERLAVQILGAPLYEDFGPTRGALPRLRSGCLQIGFSGRSRTLPAQSKSQRRYAPSAVRLQPGMPFAFPSGSVFTFVGIRTTFGIGPRVLGGHAGFTEMKREEPSTNDVPLRYGPR